MDQGIGLTDVVKRSTHQASGLTSAGYRQWASLLKDKLNHYQPLITCFHWVKAYRHYLKYGEDLEDVPRLCLQQHTIGRSRVYVTSNPSPANARFSLEDLAEWYRKLKALWDDLKG